ncbi:SMP-30/gluconolactonase/LRE family protein [Amycolatopsis aidingensis]|uniref:SMP-30/gluconolactonase/LRE family protein n=1 Tax=Amycolatopsis aidingensis TaxID=2842453 RepID=UPI001C0B8711|nr:SMP-30/gluconolactonase/LRE family protein [Amycolatopsis aidingensis]
MLRRTRARAAVLVVLLAGLLVPVPAAVAVPHRPPETISATADSLHPEGVAWDPSRRAFLVGSIRHGTVSVVRPDGTVRTLVSDPRMVSTFGVHVDAARGRILVTYADMGLGERSTEETTFTSSGVGIFDLATGRPLHLVDLAIGPGRHTANDLAIDWRGNAYVTDSSSDTIYRVTPDGRGSVLVSDQRLAGESIGMNGIVWHPAGYLLAVHYEDGRLLRIDTGAGHRIREVALPAPLTGGDGLALRWDGALVAVTNSFSAPGTDAVTVLRPAWNWSAVRVVHRVGPWPVTGPSTVALSPHGAYVLSGRLEVLLAGATSDEFDLHRLRPAWGRTGWPWWLR